MIGFGVILIGVIMLFSSCKLIAWATQPGPAGDDAISLFLFVIAIMMMVLSFGVAWAGLQRIVS